MRILLLTSVVGAFLSLAFLSWATPSEVNLQGSLSNGDGPLPGNRAYRVQFYDAVTSGNPLGAAFTGSCTVSSTGRWVITLPPSAAVLDATGNVWYELAIDSAATPDGTIDADDIFADRVQVSSVFFAQRAEDTETLDGMDSADFATTTSLTNGLAAKADSSDVYTTAEVDAFLGDKADASDVYTQSEIDTALAGKSGTSHSHNLQDLGGAVTDAQVPDTITVLFATDADRATTATYADDANALDGMDSADFATTTALTNGLAAKADTSHSHGFDEISGTATDGQIPDDITIDQATNATSATYAVSAGEADTLDGQQGAYYLDGGNLTGTVSTDRYSAYADLGAEGYLDNADNTDLLTRHQADNRYWGVDGNTGTDGSNAIGTNDNQAFRIRVNGERALKVEPGSTPNLIGGYYDNAVNSSAVGGTIAGGGASGELNIVTDNYGTIGGGRGNQAGNDDSNASSAVHATIGGGHGNQATEHRATVGGGENNTASGRGSVIAGGEGNVSNGGGTTVGGGIDNTASALQSTVAGGLLNQATASASTVAGGAWCKANGEFSAIGGGSGNETYGDYSTITGGRTNTATGIHSTVAGGRQNTAAGSASIVLGGRYNVTSGSFSLAAGYRAQAVGDNCFVWADGTEADLTCSTNNAWMVRAKGGVTFYSSNDLSNGVTLAAGGGSWGSVSNRNLKENFQPVDVFQLLERVAAMEISTWNYKAQDESIRHIGPMSDEFNGLMEDLGGEDPDRINALDADGVALGAVQGLYHYIKKLEQQNAAQQARIDELEARLSALEQYLAP